MCVSGMENAIFLVLMKPAFKKYLLLLLLASAGLAVFHVAPPSLKTLQLLPSQDLSAIAAFSDNTASGHSVIHLLTQDSLISTQIVLDTSSGRDVWAGFGWKLSDANWSFIDTVFLDIRCVGCSEVQLKLLTYDPDVSKRDDFSTYRQLVKEIPVSGNWQRIALPAEHFYVPEWWYQQHKVDKSLDSKHLESVARFDIQPSSQAPRGTSINLEVRSLTMVGSSPRNAAILLGYLFLLMLFVLGTNPHRRKPQ